MKKQMSRNLSDPTSANSHNVKTAGSRVPRLLPKIKRYIYTEKDLGEDMLHMGMTAATYTALSASF